MGKKEKASNKLKDLKGHAKEVVGTATDDPAMTAEGKNDRLESSVEGIKESVKDAEGHIKDALKRSK